MMLNSWTTPLFADLGGPAIQGCELKTAISRQHQVIRGRIAPGFGWSDMQKFITTTCASVVKAFAVSKSTSLFTIALFEFLGSIVVTNPIFLLKKDFLLQSCLPPLRDKQGFITTMN